MQSVMELVRVGAPTRRSRGESAPVDSAYDVRDLAYRPDIDGLRAVAVVAVFLYHANVPGFTGGYAGVDVFFVISGYLITRLLTPAPGHAAPGLAEFYIRRARRILPALLVTTSIVALVAVILLLPLDLIRFGKYMAAAAAGIANINALHDANYFDSGAFGVPLIHYWSLAVEEQFYLVYPAALLILARYLPRHRATAVAVAACASLAACVWGSYYHPGQTFYLAPPRGWELLLGALVALSGEFRLILPQVLVRSLRHPLVCELLAVASVLAIAAAVYSYDSYSRYPGVLTLAPCLATAALIATGTSRATWIARVLSVRPLVFTGQISYSLYLWHLPVLVFFTYFIIEAPSTAQVIGVFALSYALAVVSWRRVEKPVRNRSVLSSNRSFGVAAITLSAGLVAGGLLLSKSDGLSWRFSPEINSVAAVAGRHPEMERICGVTLQAGIPADHLCRYGPAADGLPIMLVWGDSHAASLIPAYERLAVAHHLQLFVVGRGGCRPLLGVLSRPLPGIKRSECALFNASVVRAIATLNPRLVVLNAHWIETEADLEAQPDLFAAPGQPKLRRALQQTVELVDPAKHPVCVVLDVPTMKYNVPYAIAMVHRRGISSTTLGLDAGEARGEFREFEQHVRALQQLGMVRVADPKDALCKSGSCVLEADGQPLYRDRDHLAPPGAQLVMSALESCFDPQVTSR